MPEPFDLKTDVQHLSDDEITQFLQKAGQTIYRAKGRDPYTTIQDSMAGVGSTRNVVHMPSYMSHGKVFFTRPRLNLTSSNIKMDRVMTLLDSFDPRTVAFAMRAILDTSLLDRYPGIGLSDSPYFKRYNPFISIVTNRLLSLSNWPDPVIDTETTEGGFFSESITYPIGTDQLTKSYDLTATFADVQGNIILMMFLFWTRYIPLVTRGLMMQYLDDIEAARLAFTHSIYRFIMDPSDRYIMMWSKATGCMPKSVPLGAYFNYDSNAAQVEGAMNMSIPIAVCGKIEYMDPIILREFNMLVRRYCPTIENWETATQELRIILNFHCMPYIDLRSGTNEMQWRYNLNDPEVTKILHDAGYQINNTH